MQRVRDQLAFSVVAILVILIALRAVGIRSSVASLVLSILVTLFLNVGLSYWSEHRSRTAARRPRSHDGGDIRWRDEHR